MYYYERKRGNTDWYYRKEGKEIHFAQSFTVSGNEKLGVDDISSFTITVYPTILSAADLCSVIQTSTPWKEVRIQEEGDTKRLLAKEEK